jgi:hypothetical protein
VTPVVEIADRTTHYPDQVLRQERWMSNRESDLPVPTTPGSVSVSLRGFADAKHAEGFGRVIAYTVGSISRFIDLQRLDGITVAFDYDDALAQLDRGYRATTPLTRTSNDQILGVAMAPAVLREGQVKAHLVFSASFVLPLENEDDEGAPTSRI